MDFSFKNAGISLIRNEREIRCKTKPDTVRLFEVQAVVDRYGRSEERADEEEVLGLDIDGYVSRSIVESCSVRDPR
jgi:hypothetical protein